MEHKDPSIVDLLEGLDLAGRGFVTVDHWDGDPCAVGIARAAAPRRLVYISTYAKDPGRFHYRCEGPSSDATMPHVESFGGDDVGFDELLEVINAYLRVA